MTINEKDQEDIKHLYRKEVEYLDRYLSKFIENQNTNTTIIITSDHGDEFGEYGSYSHSFKTHGAIPQLIHVPLNFIGPKIIPQIVPHYTCHLDIGPTILDIAGIDEKIGHGKSLKQALHGG